MVEQKIELLKILESITVNEYPRLFKDKHDGSIVLANSVTSGVVLVQGQSEEYAPMPVGCYYTNFPAFCNDAVWLELPKDTVIEVKLS